MTRRALWMIPFAVCLDAEPSQEVLELFTGMAASLSAGDAREFLGAFDKTMPGYSKLRENVTALAAAGYIESSVDVVREEGDAQRRTVEVSWRLRIRRAAEATASAPREAKLTCKLEKRGKKWRIVAMEPIAYFAP